MKSILLGFLLLWITTANAGSLASSIDRTTIAEGETVNLVLTIDEPINGLDPDFTALRQNFEVIGSAKSSELNVVNNQTHSQTRWIFTLLPKHAGTLTIPSLSMGSLHSQPLSLNVTSAAAAPKLKSAASSKTKAPRVFLESSAVPIDPYIQAQVIYTIRVFTQDNIQAGTLTDPVVSNAVVTRLGSDVNYQTMRDGKSYGVVERRYAIFPQQSGTTTIQSPVLKGELVETTSSSNGLGGFLLANSVPFRAAASAVSLRVRPKPTSYSEHPWLPAEHLSITENWSENPPKLHVGEPLTLTLTLNVAGLTGEQLPQLHKQSAAGIQYYATPPIIHTSHDSKNVQGTRVEKIALIAAKEGLVTLPAITVHWWNTQKHQEETVTIPSHKFMVLPPKGQTTKIGAPVKNVSSIETAPASPPPSATGKSNGSFLHFSEEYWPWIASILLAIWLITLIAWWGQKIFARSKTPTSDHRTSQDGIKYAQTPEETKIALILWANKQWPEKSLRTLGELINNLPDSPLKDAIKVLDKALYANKPMHWSPETFWHIFKTYAPAFSSADNKKPGEEPLPPLHPK